MPRFPNGRHVDISKHCEAPLRVTVLCVCSGVEMHRFGTGRLCSQSGIESRSWSPRTPLLQASSSPDRYLTSQWSNLYVDRYWDQRHVTSRYTGGDASCGCHQMVAEAKLGPCLKKCHIVSSTPARRPSIYNFSLDVTCMVRTVLQRIL